MSAEKNWQFELEEYIKQDEPGQIEKSEEWQTTSGLQAVDGLKTSAYLLDTDGVIMLGQKKERKFPKIILSSIYSLVNWNIMTVKNSLKNAVYT